MAITNQTPNEIALDFIPITKLDLLKLLMNQANLAMTCLDITNSIAFMQINCKFHYHRKYQPMIFAMGITLYYNYIKAIVYHLP